MICTKSRTIFRNILKWALTVAVVGWCIFIWQFSFAPAAKSAETSSNVQEICNEILESIGSEKQVTSHTVRKTAHFTEFFALGRNRHQPQPGSCGRPGSDSDRY